MTTDPALQHLDDFLALLDQDKAAAERKYAKLRSKLVFFFCQRRCGDPEDLADEVILRAHRRLLNGLELTSDLTKFCYGIASFVYLEQKTPPLEFDENLHSPSSSRLGFDRDRLILVEQCLRKLDKSDSEFILDYYQDDRLDLAERLGKTPNALRIRACRILESLRKLTKKRD